MHFNRRSISSRLFLIAGTIALFIQAGCGPKMHPVSGTITYADGTPMPGEGQIIFNAMEPKKDQGNPRGMIQADGSFHMGTLGEADGAPEGKYRVAIMPTPPHNVNKPPPNWPPLHRKYLSHDTSGLEFTVLSGRNKLNLVVEK